MGDKRVLVTGAGTGIGRGVALAFAAAGARVALHYAHSDAGANSAVEEIAGGGGQAAAFQGDLNDTDAITQLAADAGDWLGGFDVLVNNAGITMNKPFLEVTPEQFDTVYNVNIRAMYFLTQAVVPAMIEQSKGAVINLTSVHAYAGMTEHTVYAATKGAIVAFTRVLSLELIQKGVRVNAIAPGWIRVENQEAVFGEDFNWEEETQKIPAGFCGNPQDIAELAMFLASEESRYILGQTIVADGGQLSIMPVSGDFRQRRPITFGQGYV